MKRTHRVRNASLLASLLVPACAADWSDTETIARSTPVVDGTITWERPEVGTLFIGGGMCTATLITPQVAITAAHCVDFGTATRPGAYGRFITQASPTSTQERYTVDRYRSFGTSDRSDVALLHLATAVPDAVAHPAGISSRHPSAGELVTLYGYGCTRRNTSIGSGQKRKFQFPQGEATARLCPGDSGGPVMWDRESAVLRVQRVHRRRHGPRHLRRRPLQLRAHRRADRRVGIAARAHRG